MRIIVADDQAAVRSALCLLLEQEARLAYCAEAESAAQVLDLIKIPSDHLLLDWELPGLDMAELVPALRAARPEMQIVALSGRPEARREAAARASPPLSANPTRPSVCWQRCSRYRAHHIAAWPSRLRLATGPAWPTIPAVVLCLFIRR
jgi:CheY-like chemotaxis protein